MGVVGDIVVIVAAFVVLLTLNKNVLRKRIEGIRQRRMFNQKDFAAFTFSAWFVAVITGLVFDLFFTLCSFSPYEKILCFLLLVAVFGIRYLNGMNKQNELMKSILVEHQIDEDIFNLFKYRMFIMTVAFSVILALREWLFLM